MTCPHATIRAAAPDGRCPVCEPPGDPPRSAMTPEERAAIARRAGAERMRRSFALFVRRGWAVLEPDVPLEWEWYHDALCAHLQEMFFDWQRKKRDPVHAAQRIRNLCANLPPGTLKSRIAMVFFPAWAWLRDPTWKCLCVSTNPENVTRDSELCRDLVTSAWYRTTFSIRWSIRADIDAKRKYKLTSGGERVARGLRGAFTGLRADCLLLDDPDDAAEVFSEANRRDRHARWLTLYSRVNDPRSSIRIVVQQRVHEDDCSSRVLRDPGFEHLDIPMDAAAAGPCPCLACGRSRRGDVVVTPIGWSDPRLAPGWDRGPLLHPSRFTAADLQATRAQFGEYGYRAQFDQRPGSLEGGMFARRHVRFFRVADEFAGDRLRPAGCTDEPPRVLSRRDGRLCYEGRELEAVYLSVDASHGSLSDTASRTSLLVIGVLGADRYVLHDSTRGRTYPQTREAIVKLVDQFRPTHVLVEAKANGRPVLDELASVVPGMIPYDPGAGSKESRAASMMPAWEAGQVFVLEGAEWVEEFVHELAGFPTARHDDRVDALSQCLAHSRAHAAPVAKWLQFAAAADNLRLLRV